MISRTVAVFPVPGTPEMYRHLPALSAPATMASYTKSYTCFRSRSRHGKVAGVDASDNTARTPPSTVEGCLRPRPRALPPKPVMSNCAAAFSAR